MTALSGRRILVPVTTARQDLADRIEATGALVDRVEFLRIEASADVDALDRAAADLASGRYAWVVFTSRNAIGPLRERVASLGGASIAAVGPSTAAACAAAGWKVDVVSPSGTVADLPDAIPHGSPADRVLVAIGQRAAPTIASELAVRGFTVEKVEAYRTEDGPGPNAATVAAIADGDIDAVVLTSASAAERFATTCPRPAADLAVVSIGPSTTARASDLGIAVSVTADTATYDGVVGALTTCLAPHREDR